MSGQREEEFDEFGNLIAPEGEEEAKEESFRIYSEEEAEEGEYEKQPPMQEQIHAIARPVLHEEKQYYPSLEERYPEAEAVVQKEDAQDADEPIIKPPVANDFYVDVEIEAETRFLDFFDSLHGNPADGRTVAVVGPYHSGKTALLDLLLRSQEGIVVKKPARRYTHDTQFESQRKLTIGMKPVSLVLPDAQGKHYLLNVLDTPGHPDFAADVECAFDIVDGAIVVVDIVDGITQGLMELLRRLQQLSLPCILVLNKIDRLIIESKMSPEDAYHLLSHLVSSIAAVIGVSPTANTVLFASTKFDILFSLATFAEKSLSKIDTGALQKERLLWGNVSYDQQKRQFVKLDSQRQRTFVDFVLNPIWKVFAHCVAKDKEELNAFLSGADVSVKESVARELSLKELVRAVCGILFKDTQGFVTSIVKTVPSAEIGCLRCLSRLFGQEKETLEQWIQKVDCLVAVTKLVPVFDKFDEVPSGFDVIGRVLHGTLKRNAKLLGIPSEAQETFSVRNPSFEFPLLAQRGHPVKIAPKGSIVRVKNIGSLMHSKALLKSPISAETPGPVFGSTTESSFVRLMIEPLQPSKRKELVSGLKSLSQFNPSIAAWEEKTGQLAVRGPGEVGLDSALFFLRSQFSRIEVRLTEPTAIFAETCQTISKRILETKSLNKKNSIKVIAEVLDQPTIDNYDIILQSLKRRNNEKGAVDAQLLQFCRETIKWDAMTAKSFVAFGAQTPALLLDEIFEDRAQKSLFEEAKTSIIDGFQWALREGPLAEEPLRNIKLRITSISLSANAKYRTSEQIVGMMRTAVHKAVLAAGPRLMEPYYTCEVTVTADAVPVVYSVLAKRRAQLISENAKPGTIFTSIISKVPVLDSFGLETDIRTQSLGQALVSLTPSTWQLAPGDPLDSEAKLAVLEPAEPMYLSRDILLKTRRRKGLPDDVPLIAYFETDA